MEGRTKIKQFEKRRDHGNITFIYHLHFNFTFENLTSM